MKVAAAGKKVVTPGLAAAVILAVCSTAAKSMCSAAWASSNIANDISIPINKAEDDAHRSVAKASMMTVATMALAGSMSAMKPLHQWLTYTCPWR